MFKSSKHVSPVINKSTYEMSLKYIGGNRFRLYYVLLCVVCLSTIEYICFLEKMNGFLVGTFFEVERSLKSISFLFLQLCVTGLLVLCFVRRGNRNGYLVSMQNFLERNSQQKRYLTGFILIAGVFVIIDVRYFVGNFEKVSKFPKKPEIISFPVSVWLFSKQKQTSLGIFHILVL